MGADMQYGDDLTIKLSYLEACVIERALRYYETVRARDLQHTQDQKVMAQGAGMPLTQAIFEFECGPLDDADNDNTKPDAPIKLLSVTKIVE